MGISRMLGVSEYHCFQKTVELTSSAGEFDGVHFRAFALMSSWVGDSGGKLCCFALAVLYCM